MGKLFKILGVVFLVLILLVVGMLIWGHKAGSKRQEEFFKVVGTGEPEKLLQMIEPDLAKKVDKPVLGAWMKAINTNLGAFKGLSKKKFNTKSDTSGGVTTVQSKGTVLFEKGEAESELVFRGDRLVKFFVSSDKITNAWFKDEGIHALCRQRAQTFLTSFLANEADQAYALLHTAFQEQMPEDKFKAMVGRITTNVGALQKLTYRGVKYTDEKGKSFTVRLFYDVVCARGKTVAEVTFQFAEMAAHLNSFDLTKDVADYAPPAPPAPTE